MNKSILRLSFSLVLAASTAFLTAQDVDIDIQLPASPEAEAFKEYVDVPVSEYTGVPNINIPLYTLQEGSVQIPISLSYHAGGIRVAEEASWVGLGWSLNAGGVITRDIRDKDDFGFIDPTYCAPHQGYYQAFNTHYPILPADPENQSLVEFIGPLADQYFPWPLKTMAFRYGVIKTPYIHETWEDLMYYTGNDGNTHQFSFEEVQPNEEDEYCKLDWVDMEPDLYSFNFMGYTGKFTMNKQGQFIPFDNHGLKIDYLDSEEGWLIITQDGMKFFFGITDDARQATYTNTYSFSSEFIPSMDPGFSCNSGCAFYPCTDSYISSWFLKRIESVDGVEIYFSYNKTLQAVKAIPNVSESIRQPANNCYSNCALEADHIPSPAWNLGESDEWFANVTRMSFDYVQVGEITGTYETILFVPSEQEREDLIGGKSLDRIEIERDNNFYKKIEFWYDYFVSTPLPDENTWPYHIGHEEFLGAYLSDNNTLKRLKLDSISMCGLQNECLPDYIFGYDEIELPPKTAYSVDYWGYANGNATSGVLGKTFIPNDYFYEPDFEVDMFPDPDLPEYVAFCVLNCFTTWPNQFVGTDRQASLSHARASTLTSIIYPTDARHDFGYELHDFSNAENIFEGIEYIEGFNDLAYFDLYSESAESAYSQEVVVEEDGFIYVNASYSYFAPNGECQSIPGIIIEFWQDEDLKYNKTISIPHTEENFNTFAGGRDEIDDQNGYPTILLSPSFDVEAGTYRVRMRSSNCCLEDDTNCNLTFNLRVDLYNFVPVEVPHVGGGIRIKSITTNVGAENEKLTEFEYADDEGITTGFVHSIPKFKSTVITGWAGPTVEPLFSYTIPNIFIRYVNFNSNSQVPLTNSFAQSIVGYSKVKVNHSTLTKIAGQPDQLASYGYELKEFYNEESIRSNGLDLERYPIPLFYNMRNGSLLEHEVYSNQGIVQSTSYTYENDWEQFPWIWNCHIQKTMNADACHSPMFKMIYYALVPQWHKLMSKTERFYGTDGSGPLIKTTAYDYNNSNFQVYTETVTCGTDSKTITYKYASDDLDIGLDPELELDVDHGDQNAMLANNMTAIVLEKKINNGLGGASKVSYGNFEGLILPSKYYRGDDDTVWEEEPTDQILEYQGRFPKIVKFKADARNTEFVWTNGLIEKKYYPAGGGGRIWDFGYNNGRHLTQIIDNAGIVSDFDYDNLWRLSDKTLNNGRIQENITYDYVRTGEANQIMSLLNYPNASHTYLEDVNLNTVMKYDGAGRVISVNKEKYTQDKKDFVTGQTYNGVGHMTTETDPAIGGTTRMEYEKSILNRVTRIFPPATPDDNAIELVHGVEGCFFFEARKDENGNTTITYKDIFGRVRKVDQEGIVTEYEYDDRDQILFIYPDGGAPPYEYTYDSKGRLEKTTVPDKGETPHIIADYNDQDQVTAETLPNGTSILTLYHPTYNHLVDEKSTASVLISKYIYEDPDSHDWVKEYQTQDIASGKIISTEYEGFDDLGRPERETKRFLHGVSFKNYEYDDADNVVQDRRTHMGPSGGGSTRYHHDYDRGLRVNTTNAGITGMPGSEFYGKYTYDHRDLLVSNEVLDGLYATSYTYHPRGWMETINGVNSTFQRGEKPNCENGPNSLPAPPPGCVGPIRIVNISVFYNCLALQSGLPTNVHIDMQGMNVEYGDEGPISSSSFTIPFNGGDPEQFEEYPEQAQFALNGEPGTGFLSAEAEKQILALLLHCLNKANLGAIENPQVYNDFITLINGILQGAEQIDNSGAGGLFGMNLHYMEENTELEAPAQFNGNVAWMEWSVPYENLQQYGFQYDPHDRLVQAKYRAFEKLECIEKNTGAYDVYINEYDQLGNIQRLQRFGMTGVQAGVPIYGMIDNLEYTYDGSLPNRLTDIADHSMPTRGFLGTTSETFSYDGVGNVIGQSNIGLSPATYNFLDLPEQFSFSSGTIYNYYTGDGRKLMSVTDENGVGTKTRYYEDGFEYEDGKLVAIYHPEGRVVFNGELDTEEGTLTTYAEWAILDHLGNTRVRFVDKDKNHEIDVEKNNTLKSELIGSYHYYPFGMRMEGKWTEHQGEYYEYQYNGKEFESDLGLNWYDYGARWYDASLGRWNSVDPLADMYANITTYAYVANNPLNFIDPNGMEIINGHSQELKNATERVQKAEANMEGKVKGTSDYKDAKKELRQASREHSTAQNNYNAVQGLIDAVASADPEWYNSLDNLTDGGGNPVDIFVVAKDHSDMQGNRHSMDGNQVYGLTDCTQGMEIVPRDNNSYYRVTSQENPDAATITMSKFANATQMAHEFGHAEYQARYMKDWLNYYRANPKALPWGGHYPGDPSGNAATEAEKRMKK